MGFLKKTNHIGPLLSDFPLRFYIPSGPRYRLIPLWVLLGIPFPYSQTSKVRITLVNFLIELNSLFKVLGGRQPTTRQLVPLGIPFLRIFLLLNLSILLIPCEFLLPWGKISTELSKFSFIPFVDIISTNINYLREKFNCWTFQKSIRKEAENKRVHRWPSLRKPPFLLNGPQYFGGEIGGGTLRGISLKTGEPFTDYWELF